MKQFFAELIQPQADRIKELLKDNDPADDFINWIRETQISPNDLRRDKGME